MRDDEQHTHTGESAALHTKQRNTFFQSALDLAFERNAILHHGGSNSTVQDVCVSLDKSLLCKCIAESVRDEAIIRDMRVCGLDDQRKEQVVLFETCNCAQVAGVCGWWVDTLSVCVVRGS